MNKTNEESKEIRTKKGINYYDFLIFSLFLLAFMGFNEQITTFLLKYFVPFLSFERNVWIDLIVFLIGIAIFCYAKNKGPAEYSQKHVLIYISGCFMLIYYWCDSTFCYTKAFTLIPYYFILLLGLGLGGILRYTKERKKKKNINFSKENINIQTDDPICSPDKDLLGYMAVVEDIVNIIDGNSIEQAFSIGIVAPWGAGKSSFLNLIKLKMKDEGRYIFIEFNPRSSANAMNIQEDFLNILRDKMKDYHSSFTSYINDYMRTLQLIDDNNPISAWVSHFKLDSVEKNRGKISEIISRSGRKLVVLVDDLDRLTGEEIIEVLKLIDKNASFPNTFFISAYDKEYVNQVLKRYLENDIKRDFTDKFFKLERMLPERSYIQKLNLLGELLKEATKKGYMNVEEIEISNILAEAKDDCEVLLPTIRDIKRFYNTFIMEFLPLKNNVIMQDFFFLSLIKYAEPTEYRKLMFQEYIEIVILPDNIKAYKLKNDITSETVKCYKILEKLFPERSSNPSHYYKNFYKHISNANTFGTYFQGYKIGSLYYEDLAILMNQDIPLEKVYNKFSKWTSYENLQDLINYLLSIDFYNLSSTSEFKRYIQILLIYTSIHSKQDIFFSLINNIFSKKNGIYDFLLTNKYFENEQKYKHFLHNILVDTNLAIYTTNYLYIATLNLAQSNRPNLSIFTFKEIVEINSKNLRSTLKLINKMYDNEQYNFKQKYSIQPDHIYKMLAGCIDHIEGNKYILSEDALDIVRKSMIQVPLFYAKYLLIHFEELNNKKEILLSFNPNVDFDQLFPEEYNIFDDYLFALQNYKYPNKDCYKALSLFWQRCKPKFGEIIRLKTNENVDNGDYAKYAVLLEEQQ